MKSQSNTKTAADKDPLYYQDATALAELIRSKEVSPVEVMKVHLDRIDAVNPAINAIVTLMAEDAPKQAKAAEKSVMNGDKLGVFHGVPFTVKDAIDVAAIPTQAGSKLLTEMCRIGSRPPSAALKGQALSPLQRLMCPSSPVISRRYHVLLCPVIPFTAPLHGLQEYVVNVETVLAFHMMRATVPFNLMGLPALSVPFTLSAENLPINVQLVSGWFGEATILRIGALVESGNGMQGKHPIL